MRERTEALAVEEQLEAVLLVDDSYIKAVTGKRRQLDQAMFSNSLHFILVQQQLALAFFDSPLSVLLCISNDHALAVSDGHLQSDVTIRPTQVDVHTFACEFSSLLHYLHTLG